MKNKIMFLFLLLSIVLGFGVGKADAKTNYVYKNTNGVSINLKVYDQLVSLGFEEDEIDTMTKEEYDQFKDMKVIATKSNVDYNKTMKGKDSRGNSIEKEIKLSKEEIYYDIQKEKNNSDNTATISSVISESVIIGGGGGSTTSVTYPSNCEYLNNELFCYTDTEYKRMTTNIAVINKYTFFLKTTVEWLKMPNTRDYDLIGITIPADTSLVQNSWGGRQTYTKNEYNNITHKPIPYSYTLTSYFEPSPTIGIAMKQNLVDDLYDENGFPIRIVTKLKNSIWTQAEYDPAQGDSISNHSFYKTTGIYRHCQLNFSITGLSFGISASGPSIAISGGWDKDYDNLTLMNTLYKDSLNTYSYPTINTDYTSYINKNNVFISGKNLEKLIKLGFDRREIDQFTSSEYNLYKSYNIVSTVTKTNKSSSYKDMKLTFSKLSNGSYFVKINMEWTILPANRYYDILAIDVPSYSSILHYSGKQIVEDDLNTTERRVINYPESLNDYFSKNSSGVAMKHNLVNSAYELFITMQVELSINSSSSDYEVQGFFTHMRDYKYIDSSMYYVSSNGTGIQFENSSLYDLYDGSYYIKDLHL